jgi:hypothetical protein
MNDTLIYDIVKTGVEIGTHANNNGTLVNNVPNSLITFLATTLIGIIIRAVEKRKIKKRHKADLKNDF